MKQSSRSHVKRRKKTHHADASQNRGVAGGTHDTPPDSSISSKELPSDKKDLALHILGGIRESLNRDLLALQGELARLEQLEGFLRIASESKVPQEIPRYVT
jgi:hypothetical protein